MKVILIRHGKTPGNLLRRYIGRTDESLSSEGKEELVQIFNSREFSKLMPDDVTEVIVSPMARCKETAKILFPNAVQKENADLREMDFGIFEGKSAAELEDCSEYREWLGTYCNGQIPEGEAKEGFAKRCCVAFEKCISDSKKDTAFFLVHGGTIMSVLEKYADADKSYYQWYADNGHGFIADWKDGKLTNIEAI